MEMVSYHSFMDIYGILKSLNVYFMDFYGDQGWVQSFEKAFFCGFPNMFPTQK